MAENKPTAMELILDSDHPQQEGHQRKKSKTNIKVFLAIELLEKDYKKIIQEILNSNKVVISHYFYKLLKTIDEEAAVEVSLTVNKAIGLDGKPTAIDSVKTRETNIAEIILKDIMALINSKYSNIVWKKLQKNGLTLGKERTLRTVAADDITIWKIFRDGRRIPAGLLDSDKAELVLRELSSLRKHWLATTDSDMSIMSNRIAAAIFDAARRGIVTINDNAVYKDEKGIKYGPQWLSGKPLPELAKQGLKLINKLRKFFDKEPLATAVKAGITSWLSRYIRKNGGLAPLIIYYGFPGTGKTTLATIASYISGRIPPITVSAETEARIAGAYEEGGIVIIDEAETALSRSEVVDIMKRGATSEVCRVIKNTNGEDIKQYSNSTLILTLNKNPVTSVNDGLLRRSVIQRLTKIPRDEERVALQKLWPELEETLPEVAKYIISELQDDIIKFIEDKSRKVRSDELFNETANFILEKLEEKLGVDLQWVKEVEVIPRVDKNVDIEEEVRHELIKFSIKNRCADVNEFCRKAGIITKSGLAIITEKACQELGVLPEALELAIKRIGGKKAKIRRGPQVIPAIVIEQEKLAKWLQFEEDEDNEVWDIEIIEFEDDDDDDNDEDNGNEDKTKESKEPEEEPEEDSKENSKDTKTESSNITKEDVKQALAKLQEENDNDYGVFPSTIAKELGTDVETVEKILQEMAANGEVIASPYGYKLIEIDPITKKTNDEDDNEEDKEEKNEKNENDVKQVLKKVIKEMESGECVTPIGLLKEAISKYNMPPTIIVEVETAKEVIEWAKEKGLVTTDEWGVLIRA